MKFFIIGERELVLAFRLVGVTGIVAESRAAVLSSFTEMTGQTGSGENLPEIIILTEQAASLITEEEIAWQKKGRFPLIVEVPGLQGHVKGHKPLTEAIGEAIGVRV